MFAGLDHAIAKRQRQGSSSATEKAICLDALRKMGKSDWREVHVANSNSRMVNDIDNDIGSVNGID